MEKAPIAKKETPAVIKVKCMAESIVAALNGTTQVDLEAIKAKEQSTESLREISKGRFAAYVKMYENADSEDEKADIRRMMDALTEKDYESEEKQREFLDRTQVDNKRFGAFAIYFAGGAFGVSKIYKYRKPIVNAVKSTLRLN